MPGGRPTRTQSTDQRAGNSKKLTKHPGGEESPSDQEMAAVKELRVIEERLKRAKTNIARLASSMEGEAINAMTATQLSARIAKFDALWFQYEEAHLALVSEATSSEASAAYNDDYNVVDDQVMQNKDQCNERITALAVAQQTRDTAAAGAGASNEQQRTGVTIITGDGLNNISNTWGKFTGEHEKWISFRDCFESSIHNNEQLEPIKKFQYLLAALDGAARKTVTQLKFTASNYVAAWERLKETYEDNYTATRQLMRGLLELPRVKKPSTESLRNIVDSVHYALAQLAHFVEIDNWDHWIAFLVLSRLDARTLHAWESHRSSKLCATTAEANQMLPKWPQVKEFLDQRARILMSVPSEEMDVDNSNGEASGGQRKRPRNEGRRRSTPSEASGGRPSGGQGPRFPMCKLCKVVHPMYSCDTFRSKMSLKARAKYVEENGLCQGCLQAKADDHQCRQLACNKCQDGVAHSSFLCPTKEAEVQTARLNRERNGKPDKSGKRSTGQNND